MASNYIFLRGGGGGGGGEAIQRVKSSGPSIDHCGRHNTEREEWTFGLQLLLRKSSR